MKSTPLLLLTTTALLSTFAFADNSSSSHGLSITVPEVRLLNIKNAPGGMRGSNNSALLTFQKDPQVLGDDKVRSYSAKGYFDITTNVEAGTSKTRSIMVSAQGLDENWKLTVSSAVVPRAFAKSVTLTEDEGTSELVSGVSNIAMSDIELNYKLEPISDDGKSILDFTGEGLALTFTLTDDT